MPQSKKDQAKVDQAEADLAERYIRQQKFSLLVGDAVARADAYSRLEAALHYRPVAR